MGWLSRSILTFLTVILGLLTPVHAIGPECIEASAAAVSAAAVEAGVNEQRPVAQVFLAAYRANAPPASPDCHNLIIVVTASGVDAGRLLIVAAATSIRSAWSIQYAYAGGDPVNRWDPSGLAAYFFDGTNNHPGGENLYDGGANYTTNVRKLFESYSGDAFYLPGIGSGYAPSGRRYGAAELEEWQQLEAATGRSMHERVNYMLDRLDEQIEKGDKIVEVFGFSRGSASAVEFLNRISDKQNSGDPKYQDLEIRFVGLFDSVPAMRSSLMSAGRKPDAIRKRVFAEDPSLSSGWVPGPSGQQIYGSREYRFSLPKDLNYTSMPVHAVAIDEQRDEFQVDDLQGALQVGFRGVHSDIGGGYGPTNAFDWITRDFMVEVARKAGLEFDQAQLDAYPAFGRGDYQKWRANGGVSYSDAAMRNPTENAAWVYDDNEPRVMPKGLIFHESMDFFNARQLNQWSAPTFDFERHYDP